MFVSSGETAITMQSCQHLVLSVLVLDRPSRIAKIMQPKESTAKHLVVLSRLGLNRFDFLSHIFFDQKMCLRRTKYMCKCAL